MTDRTRIGLLGGTFDPVHKGHIQLAQAALTECELDEVVFIPAAVPPHKDVEGVTSFKHRVAMLQLVCESLDKLSCTTIEEELPRPSYTITTLRAVDKIRSGSNSFYFIIGSDSFLDMQTWHHYPEILDSFSLIVARRDDHSLQELAAQCVRLGYDKSADGKWQRGGQASGEVIIIKTVPINCSATEIKKELREGRVSRQYLTDKVAAYIIKHQLYREGMSGDTATRQ